MSAENVRKYLLFETSVTAFLDQEFEKEPDQALRNLILRTRLACRKYWVEKGRELPKFMQWQDPDEPETPAPKAKAKAKPRGRAK